MDRNPFSYQTTIETTLPFYARRPAQSSLTDVVFVHEFDCELEINYWHTEDGHDWEIVAVIIPDKQAKDGKCRIDTNSDPAFFQVMRRSFRMDEVYLSERISDRIEQIEAA